MPSDYAAIFWNLIQEPFKRTNDIWGIVPLYFSWAVAELTNEKASYKTAVQTGFNLLWAGAQWTWQFRHKPGEGGTLDLNALLAVNVIVTILTIILGAVALYSGIRKSFPPYCSFLGHTRFSSYLTITLYPIQARYLRWSWDALIAILIFAIPTWITLGLFRRALATVRGAGRKRR